MNFISKSIRRDVTLGKVKSVVTRFPPEPNGHLHIGHLKSLWLNCGIAKEHGGVCKLRFDDTNPKGEKKSYVSSAVDVLTWLGYRVIGIGFASNYYYWFYHYAMTLMTRKFLYVDCQVFDLFKTSKGTFDITGKCSVTRDQEVNDNVRLLRQMRFGRFKTQSKVLRARINMQSSNVSLRDPVFFRVSNTRHYKMKYSWSIFPTYDFAHCSSDCLEGVTHSLCTLEFGSNKELYNWLLDTLSKAKIIEAPVLPKQIEFSRLTVSGLLTSKRGVLKLLREGVVKDWDDLRLGTIASLRRLGFTQRSLRIVSTTTGITRSQSFISLEVLYNAVREDLGKHLPRRMTVVKPVRLVLENYWEDNSWLIGVSNCSYSHFCGRRRLVALGEVLIENNDPSTLRLCSGLMLQLCYGLLVRCLGSVMTSNGVPVVRGLFVPYANSEATYEKSVKIHWVSVDCCNNIIVNSGLLVEKKKTPRLAAKMEVSVNEWQTRGSRFLFERRGYFIVDYKTRNSKVRKCNFIVKV